MMATVLHATSSSGLRKFWTILDQWIFVQLSVPHFSTLSNKKHDFWKNLLNINVRFDFIQNFCLKHISL